MKTYISAMLLLIVMLGATMADAGEVCYPVGDSWVCRDRD